MRPKKSPDDIWLASASNKTALIIVADDDDMTGNVSVYHINEQYLKDSSH